jgi:hypothetical protein
MNRRTQMKSNSFFATFMFGMLLVGATVSMATQTSALRHTHDPSNTQTNGRNRSKKKSTVKKAALSVESGTKDAGKKVGKGGELTGGAVVKGSEKAANATADGARDASKATVKGVKKTGKATASGAKKVGRVFK